MSRVGLVLLALAGLAVAEVALIAWVAQGIGVLPTVGLLVLVAVAGALIARHEGTRAWRSLMEARSDPDPARVGQRLSDASLILVGGGLLVLPGFLSDVIGVLFLVPTTRRLARRGLAALLRAWTRPYRDQAAIIDLRLRPDTVVRGDTVAGADTPPPRRPDDPDVIRGEIEP